MTLAIMNDYLYFYVQYLQHAVCSQHLLYTVLYSMCSVWSSLDNVVQAPKCKQECNLNYILNNIVSVSVTYPPAGRPSCASGW